MQRSILKWQHERKEHHVLRYTFMLCMLLLLMMGSYLAPRFPQSAFAEESQQTRYSEGYYYYHSYEGFVSLCGYFGEETTVTIPSFIAAKPVSRIEAGAFAGRTSVETVNLPETIMEVQAGAFEGAPNITTVNDYHGMPLESFHGTTLEFSQGEQSVSLSPNTPNAIFGGISEETSEVQAGEMQFVEPEESGLSDKETEAARTQVQALLASDSSASVSSSRQSATPLAVSQNIFPVAVLVGIALGAAAVVVFALFKKGWYRQSFKEKK